MNKNDFSEVIDALDDVLDTEREALLTGDLDQVGRLLERKEALIDRLSQLEKGELTALDALNGKVKRNQALLDHALQGIRSVAQRLATLRRVRSSLDTYDERGSRQTIDMTTEGTVEKRA